MPSMELATDEMRTAAMACRIGAAQAQQDAERQDNPRLRATFAEAAERYTALAARFENARRNA